MEEARPRPTSPSIIEMNDEEPTNQEYVLDTRKLESLLTISNQINTANLEVNRGHSFCYFGITAMQMACLFVITGTLMLITYRKW